MIDKDCAYYKCHTELEDCTFCYCPIYPCKIEGLGEYVVASRADYTNHKIVEEKIWDCSKCNIIHDKKIVKKLKRAIKEIIEDSI